jgi:hypothetical protein
VGRLGGPSGPPWRGPCPVCLSEAWLTLVFFAGFKWGFPGCLKGPPGLSPTSPSPSHTPPKEPIDRGHKDEFGVGGTMKQYAFWLHILYPVCPIPNFWAPKQIRSKTLEVSLLIKKFRTHVVVYSLWFPIKNHFGQGLSQTLRR